MTGDLPMGAHKITGLADGVANTDAVTLGQVNALVATSPTGTVTVTAARTISNSDTGKVLLLGGAAYYAVSFPAPATVSTGIYTLQNNDTRAKKIVLSGGITYKLWPGQRDIISNVGGAWYALNGPTRYILTATTTVYIDSISGVADTDGLATGSGAFPSLSACYASALANFDTAGNVVYIRSAAGRQYSLPGDFLFKEQLVGCGLVVIDGQGSTVFPTFGTTTQNVAAINYVGQAGAVTLLNFTVYNSYGSGASISYPGLLNFGVGMVFGACALAHMQASGAGSILETNSNYTVSGGALYHFQAVQLGYLVAYGPDCSFSASCSFQYFALVDRGSLLQLNNNTYTLNGYSVTGYRFNLASGGNVSGSGSNPNFFPGTAAGVNVGGFYL